MISKNGLPYLSIKSCWPAINLKVDVSLVPGYVTVALFPTNLFAFVAIIIKGIALEVVIPPIDSSTTVIYACASAIMFLHNIKLLFTYIY